MPMPSEIAAMLNAAKLTKKQRRFILAFLRHLNGSKAARIAGYSVKCAYQQAYENLRKSKIRSIVDEGIRLQYTGWAVDPAVINDVGGGEPEKCW